MSRLNQIAERLGQAYRQRADLQVREGHLQQDTDARRLVLTPAEGWPGKNEEARKMAAERTFAEDETLQLIRNHSAAIRKNLITLNAEIDSLEADRRALEWGIRERLADALAGRQNYSGDPAETAFDDGADEHATSELHQQLEEDAEWDGSNDDEGEPELEEPLSVLSDLPTDDDDIPF